MRRGAPCRSRDRDAPRFRARSPTSRSLAIRGACDGRGRIRRTPGAEDLRLARAFPRTLVDPGGRRSRRGAGLRPDGAPPLAAGRAHRSDRVSLRSMEHPRVARALPGEVAPRARPPCRRDGARAPGALSPGMDFPAPLSLDGAARAALGRRLAYARRLFRIAASNEKGPPPCAARNRNRKL